MKREIKETRFFRRLVMNIQHQLRDWVFLYLIIFVALLWGAFLLAKGQMVWVSTMLAIVAILIMLFSFTICRDLRTWIFFYLICLVAILWAAFLLARHEMIWVSVFLLTVAIGIHLFSFVLTTPETRELQTQTN